MPRALVRKGLYLGLWAWLGGWEAVSHVYRSTVDAPSEHVVLGTR